MTEETQPRAIDGQACKVLMGLSNNDQGEVLVSIEVVSPAAMAGGQPDFADTAVFMADWVQRHWRELHGMAASEYNVRQTLRMATAKPALQLVDPNGGRLQ